VQYNFYTTPKHVPATVLVTHDGGMTWHRASVAAGTVLQAISCSGAKTCAAVGTTRIFATSDGGTTWQRQLSADRTPLPQLNGIACPAPGTCYAVGGIAILASRSPRTLDLSRLRARASRGWVR
jgi:photosystem II stability/assembly factor-like uncharacterized protein